jgi:diguanylate cyclase (GGDEF)-like protein/PAS domain S-box-containing protein
MLLRYKTKDGNYKWIESIGEVINRDKDGVPIKLVGVRRDVDKKKRMDDLVKKAERRYRQLMNNSINAIAVYEAVDDGNDFIFVDFNQMACKIEGYDKRQVVGHTLKELFPVAVESGFLDILKNVYKTSKPQHYMLHYLNENGKEVWRDNYVYKLPSGEVVAVYQDITQEKLNQRTINILSLALQKSKNIIYIADDKCNLMWVNEEFESVMGYSLKDIVGKNVWSIYNLPKEQIKKIYRDLEEDDFWKGELKIKTKNDKYLWERSFISLIREEGKVVNVVKVGEDITKEKEMEERLKEYANIDELTKVLNRRAGYLLLETEAKKAKRKKLPLVVAFVDMDNLKKVNDNFGHEKGDEFILKMVEIFKSSVRDTDSIMRIGGDEFVIIFPESTIQDVEHIFKERILKRIDEYNSKSNFNVPLGLSYGLAEYNDFESDFDIEEILKIADTKMYKMKTRKKTHRN